MTTDSKQNTPNHEEIDLLSLFVKMGEFIKKAILGLINVIGSVLIFLLRKWYYLFIAIVLTVISALILNNIADSYYYSDLILRSNATHNQPIMSSIDKLGDYANTRNYATLSNELNLSLEDASAIKRLETFWYYDIGGDGVFDGIDIEGKFLSDTSIVIIDSVFVVRAAVYNPAVLNKIEGGLLHYLESNPFLDALNKQRLSNLEAQLNQTQYEIEKLDSLQKREYYTNTDDLRQKEGQIVFTSEKIIRIYHHDMFRLLESKQECERDLNIYNDVVTILEGFSVPTEPDNSTIKYAKKMIWFYLVLSLVAAIIISFRKKIWVR